MAPDDGEGRQHERTILAWLRTALSAVVVGLFMVRQANPGAERWLVGACAALGIFGVLAVMRQRTTGLNRPGGTVAAGDASVAVIVGSLGLLELAGLLLAF